MPNHKGNISKPEALSKKPNKEDNDEVVEMAAEQLARLFWEQIKYNCQQELENKKIETKQEGDL